MHVGSIVGIFQHSVIFFLGGLLFDPSYTLFRKRTCVWGFLDFLI